MSERATGLQVECGPLGAYLALLNVRRIDYMSVDVEGSEPAVLESLALAPQLSVGVVTVEVRGDGQRGRIMRTMLHRGFHYVGQLYARANTANAVVDDCYANFSHLRRYFPRARGSLLGPHRPQAPRPSVRPVKRRRRRRPRGAV